MALDPLPVEERAPDQTSVDDAEKGLREQQAVLGARVALPLRRATSCAPRGVDGTENGLREQQALYLSEVVNHHRRAFSKKELGAYYTDKAVADFLVRWAVRDRATVVLDPSSGDGVFLSAAARRIQDLGGDPVGQVHGVEIDGDAHEDFADATDRPRVSVRHSDFFDLLPGDLPMADAVVGNPPFIRYQRFTGEARRTALRRAEEAGVRISRLASSWAPFLVHSIRFVKAGGRLAMVAPIELAHAGYARPVVDYLRRSFRSVEILTFSRKLFPRLSEDTVLVLASGRGEPFESLRLVDLPGPSALRDASTLWKDAHDGSEIDARAVESGEERLLHYLLPESCRHLYRQLRSSPQVAALGQLADVGIGYVTGDNDFFHVNRALVEAYGLPERMLRRAVRSGADLLGLRYTYEDWKSLHDGGQQNLLLHISNAQPLPESVRRYLVQGERKGVPARYKCRVREPWYAVPHVYDAAGFLTYMSGRDPRLVSNEAGAVAPNTLHLVRPYPNAPLGPLELAATWQSSLTALSCELEGHSLGGGMLKLEPTEARRVAVVVSGFPAKALSELAQELDGVLRARGDSTARERADEVLLRDALGLSQADILRLREGWLTLKRRRLSK